jgi:hypothetical protein
MDHYNGCFGCDRVAWLPIAKRSREMQANPADIEAVPKLLAATPRRIASLSRGLEGSRLRIRADKYAWPANDILANLRASADVWGKGREQMVLSYARRIAQHEREHCEQIETLLKGVQICHPTIPPRTRSSLSTVSGFTPSLGTTG